MIVTTLDGSATYNYVGSAHHIPSHVIRPSHKNVLKKTLHKPALKRWWYLNLGRVDEWVECEIVEQKMIHRASVTIVEYYDRHWEEDFTAQVFDHSRLKFAAVKP